MSHCEQSHEVTSADITDEHSGPGSLNAGCVLTALPLAPLCDPTSWEDLGGKPSLVAHLENGPHLSV